jgi:hypothetical protein
MNKHSLETVKAGDVLLISGHFKSDDRLEKVDRVTKTQVVIGNTKFRMVDGYAIGYAGSWNVPRAIIPSPDQIENIKFSENKRFLINKLQGVEVTKKQVHEMLMAFDQAKEKAK